MIQEYIKQNSIIIIPNSIKIKVLDSFNSKTNLINTKLMSFDELKKHYLFDYSNETILYIMDKYNIGFDFSKTILNNLYYISIDEEYDNDKLLFLKEVKKDLIENKYIIFDNMFLNYIKNKNILVYGYSNIDKISKNIMNNLNGELIRSNYNYSHEISVFNTLEDEVSYVFKEISKLLVSGVNLNKIKLSNVSDKYQYTLKRYSKLYNIPVVVNDESIYSSKIVKDFLNVLKESKSFKDSIQFIKENYDLSKEKNVSIYSKLLNLSNKYNDLSYDFDLLYNLVLYDVKNINNNFLNKNEQLEIVDFENNIFSDDEYIFLMNFNQGEIPIFYKDEDYISDNVKVKYDLDIDTTEQKNINSKNSLIYMLNNTKNLFISCKLKSIDSEYEISNIVSELNYKIKYPLIDFKKCFSYDLVNITLGKYLDDFIKYGIRNNDLDFLFNNIENNYLTYSNSFSGIDNSLLLESLKPKLILSYSQLSNYYNCSFRYYISQVLKIDKYEKNFSTVIGSLFHYVLSVCFEENFDFELEYNNYVSNLELNIREKFFIVKLKNELKLIIDRVKELHNETGLTKLLLEHKITIDKSSVIPVVMTGIVDKIMYKEKDKTLVSIVDYKTGSADINLYNVIYGLSMQLPIYLYLVKKSNLFNNVRFTGFYLQKILSNEVGFTISKSYLEQKNSNLKLEGYSNEDISILETFIPDYENSKFVKSMKVCSSGFYSYVKVLNDFQIDKLIDVIDKKIDEARDNILSGNFDINPKQIGNDRIGCNYCKFKDICYKTNNDFVKLEENKSLDFLNE